MGQRLSIQIKISLLKYYQAKIELKVYNLLKE